MPESDVGVLTELSLFSGYGGFTLGLGLAGVPVRTVCYVELDSYCQRLIQARITDCLLDDAPIWDDAKSFDGEKWSGCVDIITAGFPCQPHSVAGQRRGSADERNLWPDTLRIVREVGPRWVLLENVPGILANGYAGTVVGQLSEAGYDCWWDCVSAAEVGAPHRRLRWWLLAHARSTAVHQQHWGSSGESWERESQLMGNGQNGHVADTLKPRRSEAGIRCKLYPGAQPEAGGRSTGTWWAAEPDVGRVAPRDPNAVVQLRTAGNGIVPAVVAKFLRGGS